MRTFLPLVLAIGLLAAGDAVAQTGTEALQGASGTSGAKRDAINSAPEPAARDTAKVYGFPDLGQPPEYPGGMTALYTYLREHLTYPQKALDEEASGKVYVKFTIDKDGSVMDAVVRRGVHPELDAEAVRVVRSMPAWSPGSIDGRNVKCMYTLPINFVIPVEPEKEHPQPKTK